MAGGASRHKSGREVCQLCGDGESLKCDWGVGEGYWWKMYARKGHAKMRFLD